MLVELAVTHSPALRCWQATGLELIFPTQSSAPAQSRCSWSPRRLAACNNCCPLCCFFSAFKQESFTLLRGKQPIGFATLQELVDKPFQIKKSSQTSSWH